MSQIGHNSAGAELRQFVERIERLEEEKKDIADSIKEVYAELKGRGYDAKIVRMVISRRKKDRDELAEIETLLETYEMSLNSILADDDGL